MKKFFTLLLVLGLCLPLCGCMALDELRTSRANYTADGLIRLSDGSEYKLLPECEELYPDFTGDVGTVNLAEEELPLLLTVFGDYASKSSDGQFLRVYQAYYCRTDVYDSVLARIQNGFTPEVYGYTYYDRENGEYPLCELTPAQAAAVEQVYTSQEPEKLPTAAKLQYEHKVDLYLYSADHLFRRDTLDICLVEGEYFLVGDDNTLYTVPAELSAVFTEIMAKKVGGNLTPHVDG